MAQETWKPIVGYEDRYAVSNLGRVKSLKYRARNRGSAQPSKVLTPVLDGKGFYLRVKLYNGNGYKSRPIHQLVLEAFAGDCPEGMVVNHKDGNKQNNTLGNLEYVTLSQNSRHAMRNNFRSSNITVDEVYELRELYATGNFYQWELAERFGITQQQVSRIINKKRWSYV
jgi:hypothetical protein